MATSEREREREEGREKEKEKENEKERRLPLFPSHHMQTSMARRS